MRVLIIGRGYVGSQLAADLARSSHEVSALSRTAPDRPELIAASVRPIKGDITEPDCLANLPRQWDWVVNCVSSSRGTMDEYRKAYLEGTRNLLDWLGPTALKKFVYTSSTGVYGQDDGSVVTEDSPAMPASETGKVLVETENILLTAARERRFPAVILRVSGIYGPGRGYWLNQFLTGEARLDGTGDRILNMVHRDDVVGAIIAALEKGRPGEIYNVTDDEPVSQLKLFEWLSKRLQKTLPPTSETGQATGRKRAATSKGVSSARLKAELGYQLKYPTFREGFDQTLLHLQQSLAASQRGRKCGQ
jgi:nucleoside-diphosphate-sugar epimerase